MGQRKTIITPEQEVILDEIRKNDFLKNNFYFTGGTALSEVYLKHRYSDDLDFFTPQKFDHQVIFVLMEELSKKNGFTFTSNFVEVVYIFNLLFNNGEQLKVDFGYYPYKKIKKEFDYRGIAVDSLFDIAVNKLLTTTQRVDAKDFVDLYYLLDKFSFGDLLGGVKTKFNIDIDPLLLASDFFVVEKFEFLPRMIEPLTLADLKEFFLNLAKRIGRQATV